jgi:hypothetical protein
MTASDPFAALADRQIVAPRKARLRAAQERTERARQKALEERHELFRLWQKQQRQQVEALLHGSHGAAVHELAGFLEQMTLTSGSELIELVRRGPWREADSDTRFQVLRLIDGALAQLREHHDLPPFDDALPGEPLTVFQIIRAELGHD